MVSGSEVVRETSGLRGQIRAEVFPLLREQQKAMRQIEKERQRQLDEHMERIGKLITEKHMELLRMLGENDNQDYIQRRAAQSEEAEAKLNDNNAFLKGVNDAVRMSAGMTEDKYNADSSQGQQGTDGYRPMDTESSLLSDAPKQDRSNRAVPEFNLAGMLNPAHLEKKRSTSSKGTGSRTSEKGKKAILNKKASSMALTGMSFTAGKIVTSDYFMVACHMLVFANTIFIGIETDVNNHLALEKPREPEPSWCRNGNRIFTGFFCAELLIRIAAFRRKFFCGAEYMWNYFDTFLVITAIAEELLSSLNLSFVRILRLSRLVRAGRIIRVLHFFKSLRLMVICIFHSLASLFWALLLLFLIMYLFSICCLNGATAWLREHPDAAFAPPVDFTDRDTLGDREMRDTLHQMYKGLFRSLLSLLMAISGGVDWYDAVRPFMGIDPIYTVMFLMYILFVVFGVLNVVTGVFVESAMQLRDRDLLIHSEMERTEEFLNDMRELFLEADADNTGRMCWNELKDYFKNERVVAYFTVHQLDVSDAYFIFKLLDTDGSGEIEIDEFAMGCMRLKGQAKTSDMLRIMQESAKINQQIFADLDHFNDQIVYVQNQLANLAAMSPTRRFSGKNLSRLLKGGSNNSLTGSSEGDVSASGGPDSPTAPQTDSPTLASPAVV
jgi:hypothetical protein